MNSDNMPAEQDAFGRTLAFFLFLAGGIVAAVGSGFAALEFHEHFELPQELKDEAARSTTPNPPPELAAREREADIRNDYHNAALVLGVSGGLLCLLLGGFAGLSRRGGLGLILGWILGAALGGSVGAGCGLLSRFVVERFPRTVMDEFYRAMLMQLAAWAPLGLVVGITVGLFSGRFRTFIGISISSLLAAGLGGVLYPFVSMIVFPSERLSRPIPESLYSGLLWAALPCLLVAVTTGRLFASRPGSASAAPPASSTAAR